ncbi:CheR family methyltransferase [Micromonosporaceae bacterium Da 78-11]
MSGGPDVTRFRALLARWLGWTFDDNDTGQLDQVLGSRAGTHGLSRESYLSRLGAGPWSSEITALAENLSITETYFFRHGEQFRALRDAALPERVAARATQRVLRMLSVACSSGEEAYTLAIVGRQVRPDPEWIIRVTGLDANPAVLRKAAAAKYSTWSLRETPDGVRQRWFRPCDGGYQVSDEARALVQFQRYNVADEDPVLWQPGQYDVIFCRNLLMYLTAEVASALIGRMTQALAPGGYLFLGHTDSLGSRPDGLEPQHSHQTFYYRRQDSSSPRPAVPVPAVSASTPVAAAAAPEDRYQRIMALLHDERFAEALAIAGRPDGPRRPRDLQLHGVLLALSGRLDEATAMAREVIGIDGLNADAHQLLGLCLEATGTVDEALGQYRLAAYLDPSFALPRLRLGQLARRRGDDRTAADELDRALGLLATEREERITMFGGGFGRIALTVLCRSELDAVGARR